MLQSFATIGGNLYGTYLENAVTTVKLVKLSNSLKDGVPPGGVGSLKAFATMSISGRWDSKSFFYTSTSFVQPSTISYYHRVDQGNVEILGLWTASVPVKPDDFDVKQVRYKSKDGTEIPMFLVHKKGLQLDGTNPTLSDRLRRLQPQPDAGLCRAHGAVAASKAAFTRCPTCAAAANSAKPGTRPGCWRRSKTSSTTSSLPPSG